MRATSLFAQWPNSPRRYAGEKFSGLPIRHSYDGTRCIAPLAAMFAQRLRFPLVRSDARNREQLREVIDDNRTFAGRWRRLQYTPRYRPAAVMACGSDCRSRGNRLVRHSMKDAAKLHDSFDVPACKRKEAGHGLGRRCSSGRRDVRECGRRLNNRRRLFAGRPARIGSRTLRSTRLS